MAKGRSGLPIDSSDLITTRFFLHNPTVLNSFPEQQTQNNNTQNFINLYINKQQQQQQQQHIFDMDSITTTTTKTGRPYSPSTSPSPSPPTTIQFPVNLINSIRDHEEDHHYQRDEVEEEDACLLSDHHYHHRRAIIDEMDFFADKNQEVKPTNADHDDLKDPKTPPGLEFNVNTGLNLLTTNTISDQSMVDDGISANIEDKKAKTTELAVLQADLERMKIENLRLRDMLNQVTTNYNALQVHLVALIQGPKGQGNCNAQDNLADRPDQEKKVLSRNGAVPRQFTELGLAAAPGDRSGGGGDKDEFSLICEEGKNGGDRSRSLGHDNNNNSNIENGNKSGNNEEEEEEEDPDQGSQGWEPNKVARFNSSKDVDQTEATIRKARVSVRARSEAPMITDGCQWRKYGQKMAKGNPCPRAYYRCTMAAGCSVRKQVQRCAEDRTVLITTYEGNHNHPLPPAAMAMASTTSSAARMLLSGSMPSADGVINSSNFLTRTLLPCSSSMATISASAPFPTVTLDLTQNPNPLQFQRQPPHIQVPFPNPPQNFTNTPAAGLLPQILGQALYNQSKFSGLQMSQDMDPSQLGRQGLHHWQQNALADTVSTATAAIAADPNFTAALAAAITSMIGGAHPNNVANANNNPLASSSNGNTTTSNSNSNGNNKVTSSSFPAN